MLNRPPAFPPTAAILLLCTVLSAGSLIVGADYIGLMLPGGLPFGNLLAAAVFCGLAGAAVVLAPRGSRSRPPALVALAGAVGWLPLSIALAGNAALNFSGERGTIWLWLSAGLFIGVMATLLLAAGASYLARRRTGGAV